MPPNYVQFQRDPPSGTVAIQEKKTQGWGMQNHLTILLRQGLNVILDGVITQKVIKWSLAQWCCVSREPLVRVSFSSHLNKADPSPSD